MGIINPYANQPATEGPEIRLLACTNCKTVEVLDDYTGPQERADEYDVVLNLALEKHKDGVERIPHIGQVFRVKLQDWNHQDKQGQILQQVLSSLDPEAETGLGSVAYSIRDNFRADAMSCWEQHLRTPSCSDYKSDAKRLVPDTSAERKELGMGKASEYDRNNPALTRFLCEYCPVHSLVQQSIRKKAGLYDN